ncbi:polyhomeotic-proximal chromatin protein-like [Drosophila serrata]|uniref:polyhomeotic-proximal chromatin protein-like n=1 Tax=Drosophila serrata TaxID=7274 RepID=UPI000A1D238C|nr:polyhomeotic-proximal chromatin protein-like [Drosophila serrata]
MFIRQPATQTLQTQENLSSEIIQCNVTQTPPKARTQLDALAPKQQQQQEQKQKQQLAVPTARLQQQQQLTSAALQCPGAPILPHNGTQVRPAISVFTQLPRTRAC